MKYKKDKERVVFRNQDDVIAYEKLKVVNIQKKNKYKLKKRSSELYDLYKAGIKTSQNSIN